MIYNVNSDIFDKIVKTIPYLRYNDTIFVYVCEEYLSKEGRWEKPWVEPKDVNIHRLTANHVKNQDLDFEKDTSEFVRFCKEFFTEDATKSLTGISHYLIVGEKDNMDATQIANWNVLRSLLKKYNIKAYLELDRWLIRIPCGSLNINLVKFEDFDDLYLEITSEDPENDTDTLKKLQEDLQLQNPLDSTWADIYINH